MVIDSMKRAAVDRGLPEAQLFTILIAEPVGAADGLSVKPHFETESYRVLEVDAGARVIEVLRHIPVDLVILNGVLRGLDAVECCRMIKANRRTELVPVLMMMDLQHAESLVAALDAGADDLMGHPFHTEVLRARVRSLLRHKAITDRLEESEAILFALAQAVEQRDTLTGGHCERLGLLSLALGTKAGLTRQELLALHRGGYLHDIGKIAMPDSILLKPGPLDDQEWATMKTHPIKGEQICRGLSSLEPVLPIIRSHHERWDGSGYPDGLKGERIPLLARILQLADIYDALTSARPYKDALPPEKALEIMSQETDRGWRDPELMALFLQVHQASLLDGTIKDSMEAANISLQNLRRHLQDAGVPAPAEEPGAGGKECSFGYVPAT